MTHLRSTLVVGHGMVGHRLVRAAIERGLTETHDDPRVTLVLDAEVTEGEGPVALGATIPVGAPDVAGAAR